MKSNEKRDSPHSDSSIFFFYTASANYDNFMGGIRDLCNVARRGRAMVCVVHQKKARMT